MEIIIFIIYTFILLIACKRKQSYMFLSPLVVIPILYFLCYFLPYLAQKCFGYEIIEEFDLEDPVLSKTMIFLILWLLSFVFGVLLSRTNQQRSVIVGTSMTDRDALTLNQYIFLMNIIGVILIIWAETKFKGFFSNFRAYKIEKTRSGLKISSLDRCIGMIGMIMVMFSILLSGYLKGIINSTSVKLKVIFNATILPYVIYLFATLSRGLLLPFALSYLTSLFVKRKINYYHIIKLLLIALVVLAGTGVVSQIRGRGSGGGLSSSNDIVKTRLDISETLESINGLQTMVWVIEYTKETNLINGLLLIAIHINPAPSFIYNPQRHMSLAREMGITSVGIPMPAIGEAYFRLGYWGLLIALLFGYICGYVWYRVNNSDPNLLYIFLYIMLIYSVVIGVHSNIRAATRGIVWILLIWLIFRSVFFKRKINHPIINDEVFLYDS